MLFGKDDRIKDVWITDNEKLIKAAKNGDLEKVKYLVEELATDINAENYGGTTPLYEAINAGHTEIADYLGQKDKALWPTLEVAIKKNNLSVVQELVENKNLDVNYQPHDTCLTALHLAAQKGRLEITQYLVEQGADIAAYHFDAVSCMRMPACYLLYSQAVDFAKKNKHKRVQAFLQKCVEEIGYKYPKPPTRLCYLSEVPENRNAHIHPTLRRSGSAPVTPINVPSTAPITATGTVANSPQKRRQRALHVTRQIGFTSDEVRKLAMIGELCQILKAGDYNEAKTLYEEIEPKLDKVYHKSLQEVVRNQR